MSAAAHDTLTLRQAYERYYLPAVELGDRTREKYRTSLAHWERLTGNPPVTDVTNETVADWRQSLLDEEYAPQTINNTWRALRAVFRLLGPQEYRNPFGLGILTRVPAMRSVKGTLAPPYRVPLEDIDATYRAAHAAQWPLTGVPPADVWRALLVLTYTTGMRRTDLHRLVWDDLDLDRGEFNLLAHKTGKQDVRKLHPVAVAHLRRICRQTERVFHGLSFGNNGNAYKVLHALQRAAGVKRHFTLHDLRRTGGSEIDRIHPGAGRVFLQQAPRGVSELFYINREQELAEAVLAMRLPAAFTGDVPPLELPPLGEIGAGDQLLIAELPLPNRGEWAFRPGAFRLAGRWFPMRSGTQLELLALLAQSRLPVTSSQVASHLGRSLHRTHPRYLRKAPTKARARVAIAGLRDSLRVLLGLPDSLDPVPCVQSKPAAWSIYLPDYVLDRLRQPSGE